MPARSGRVSFCLPPAHLVLGPSSHSGASSCILLSTSLASPGLSKERPPCQGRYRQTFFFYSAGSCVPSGVISLWPELSTALAGRLWIQAGVSDTLNRELGVVCP